MSFSYLKQEYITCYLNKCCGACKRFTRTSTIVSDPMGGNEIEKGICDFTGFEVLNRNIACKAFDCRDGVVIAPSFSGR